MSLKCLRTLIITAIGGASSASFAGFTVTASVSSSSGGLDQYRVTAVNNGGNTGTQIKGLEYFYNGSPAFFEVTDNPNPNTGDDPNGIPDTVNLTSATRSRIRVNSVAANNVFVGVAPDNGFVEPNPYLNGVGAFQGAIANTGVTQATGAGFEIARFYLPTGGSFVLSGNIGGDIGAKVPFNVTLSLDYAIYIASVTPNPVNVAFGPIVSQGAAFSTTIVIGGAPTGGDVSLALDSPLPQGIHDISIVGGGTQSRTFVVSGIVDYALNGTQVVLPFTANCPGIFGPTTQGAIVLNVTPEPTTIVCAIPMMFTFHRRRARAIAYECSC